MSRTYKDYSADDKAVALNVLKANGDNVSATSRDTNIPASTLTKWKNGEGISDQVVTLCDEKKEDLADLFDRIARKYLAQAEREEVIAATKGKDAVTSAAIAADKRQLLRGEATSIVGEVKSRAETVKGLVKQKYGSEDAPAEAYEEMGGVYDRVHGMSDKVN